MSSSPQPEVCRKERAATPPPLIQNGKIVIQTHQIGWIIAGCFTIIATAISFWLVNKHLQWYTNKREQRYIVRILFMVPLYATISLASYLWWNQATPLILIQDGYESTVLTAFFYLLLTYLSHDTDEQRLIFMKHGLSRQNDAERIKKGEQPQRWVFPLGLIKWKPVDGLYFLQLMKWGVLQYSVLLPLTTLIAVILNYVGLYCESSWGLGWGHIYITIILSISVTVAMYCLIQFYFAVSKDLARHKPLLKLLAIKAVVFLTFWQATFLSLLSMFGVVKDTQYMTAEDINIGIGALLETFEMMLFAALHVRAFTYKVYLPPYDPHSGLPPPQRTPRLKSLRHAMDFRETFRELWVGCIYMWHKFRGKEPAIDTGAIRATHYEGIFGKQRPTQGHSHHNDESSDDENIELKQPTLPRVQVEVTERVEVDIGGEKQWLGLGNNYVYGLLRRERSEGLEEQIEKELEKRGYTLRNEDDADLQQPKHPKQKSWWRSIYNRISQSGRDEPRQVQEEGLSANVPLHQGPSRKRTGRRSHSKGFSRDGDVGARLLAPPDMMNTAGIDLEDQPPPSLIARKNKRELRRSVDQWRKNVENQIGNDGTLMPVPTPTQGHLDYRRTVGHEHGHVLQDNDRGRHREVLPGLPGASSLPITPVVVDSRHQSHNPPRSLDTEGRRERMFRSAMNDLPTELSYPPTSAAQPETSSAEGYRLSKPTPLVQFIPSHPSVIPANQLGMAARQHSTQYHPATEDVHMAMTADIVEFVAEEKENRGGEFMSTSPSRTHRRESASPRIPYPDLEDFPMPPRITLTTLARQSLPQPPPRVGPSTLPTTPPSSRPPAALRRSLAQYHPNSQFISSRRRESFPSNIDIPYPSSILPPMSPGRRRQPHHSREGHLIYETGPTSIMRSHMQPVPSAPTSPRISTSPSAMNSPVSQIHDGLSRYPAHVLPEHSTIPRHS